MKRLNLVDKEYGRLKVISLAYIKNGRTFWNCRCSCGNETILLGKDIKNGNTKSCGCLKIDTSRQRMTTHGATDSRLYNIWTSMKQRCETSKIEKFVRDYQNRGIKICAEWHDFSVFQKWALENGYKENLSIDRIDNNKGYFPENCRWVDNFVQANNKRNNYFLTYNNKTQSIEQWARELGIKGSTIHERLRRGWSVDKTLTTKIYKREVLVMG